MIRHRFRVQFAVPQLVFALSMAVPHTAKAQDVATADALFAKGLEEMNAGRYDVACPALEGSLRIDPAPGTLFTLAECEAKAEHVATAFARYEEYLQIFAGLPQDVQKRQLDRKKISLSQKQRLGPLMPFLTVVLASSVPEGTRVHRDKLELSGPALGLALPVDPGVHQLVLSPPDQPEVKITISISVGEKKTVTLDVPPLEPPKPPEQTSVAPPKEVPPPPVVSPPSNTVPSLGKDKPTGGNRSIVFVVGGVGVAALGVGAVTGLMAWSTKETIEAHCDGPACRDTAGLNAAERGQNLALASTVGFGVGVLGIATGVVLFAASSTPTNKASVSGFMLAIRPLPLGGAELHCGGQW